MIPLVALILFNTKPEFPFSGASLLIVVGVGLDTLKQIQQRNYRGLLRPSISSALRVQVRAPRPSRLLKR